MYKQKSLTNLPTDEKQTTLYLVDIKRIKNGRTTPAVSIQT